MKRQDETSEKNKHRPVALQHGPHLRSYASLVFSQHEEQVSQHARVLISKLQ
jgi:hypothetical protein